MAQKQVLDKQDCTKKVVQYAELLEKCRENDKQQMIKDTTTEKTNGTKNPSEGSVKFTSEHPQYPQENCDSLTAAVWSNELRKMNSQQQRFVKKAINDIIFKGQMGTLNRNSVKINSPRVSIDGSVHSISSNPINVPFELNKICRVCFIDKGDMHPIFGTSLEEMINCLFNLKVTDGDGLPSRMCAPCVLQCRRAYIFKQSCEKYCNILQQFIVKDNKMPESKNNRSQSNNTVVVDTMSKSDGGTKVSKSLGDEVKLNCYENPSTSTCLFNSSSTTEEDRETEDLYKRVRDILNKLTSQDDTYAILLSQLRSLKITTEAHLKVVVNLVFQKAVDEPNFSVFCALLCKRWAVVRVPTANHTGTQPDYVTFRKLLFTLFQTKFEKQLVDESKRLEKVREIDECNDPERKKDLEFELEEYDRRVRKIRFGTIRFMGELFKQKMLAPTVMIQCLDNLLENKNEERLECLCILLTTIGKQLETKQIDLRGIFQTMSEIVDRKQRKVSSRVRFMLKDVIDLRASQWVSCSQGLLELGHFCRFLNLPCGCYLECKH